MIVIFCVRVCYLKQKDPKEPEQTKIKEKNPKNCRRSRYCQCAILIHINIIFIRLSQFRIVQNGKQRYSHIEIQVLFKVDVGNNMCSVGLSNNLYVKSKFFIKSIFESHSGTTHDSNTPPNNHHRYNIGLILISYQLELSQFTH